MLGPVEILALVLVAVVVPLLVAGLVLRAALVAPKPGFIAVLSGRRYPGPDGEARGYRIIRRGRAIRIPMIEQADVLDCRRRPVHFEVRHAYTAGNHSVDLQADVEVGVTDDTTRQLNAVERFLGRAPKERDTVAAQTLEGVLREQLATTTVEAARGDLDELARRVEEAAKPDLDKLGLEAHGLQLRLS